jgi:CubicO group peptidase (beta-lactamase class C family)
LVEEVTGEAFESYVQRTVLQPLGMNRSTFAIDPETTPNLAAIQTADGTNAPHRWFTALAATSFYTTTEDLTLFVLAHLPGTDGQPIGRGVLKPETVTLMRKPHASVLGADMWGLGTMLYVPNGQGDFIIGHDGKNEPAINASARLNPANGDSIILLETGKPLLVVSTGARRCRFAVSELILKTAGRKRTRGSRQIEVLEHIGSSHDILT